MGKIPVLLWWFIEMRHMNYLTKYMAFIKYSIVVIGNMMALLSFLFFSVGVKEETHTHICKILQENKNTTRTYVERGAKRRCQGDSKLLIQDEGRKSIMSRYENHNDSCSLSHLPGTELAITNEKKIIWIQPFIIFFQVHLSPTGSTRLI